MAKNRAGNARTERQNVTGRRIGLPQMTLPAEKPPVARPATEEKRWVPEPKLRVLFRRLPYRKMLTPRGGHP